MFSSIANWYRELEHEHLSVLQDPSLAAQAPAGYRRHFANKLAQLSAIERQQLREFTLKYRGARLLAAVAQLLLLFTLIGAAAHLALPQFGWGKAITMV